ncbi:hypothetical protein ACIRPK_22585 [Kitasatospora sp. NPDC101801]|uniref:hypothetical protein n=1 Tax=Kitasatospora sp. NPDC101801 TaxID=3364103 RepID=UPI00382C553D
MRTTSPGPLDAAPRHLEVGMALFLFIVLIAVVFGFVGVLVKGMLWLLVIGAVLFILALVFGGMRLGKRSRS